MSSISRDIVDILQYLLPGFLCAWVFYGLTSCTKPSEFERVVQALIFTLLIHALTHVESAFCLWLGRRVVRLGEWNAATELANVTIMAVFLGAVFAFCVNTDCLHSVARRIGVTRETSFPSNWFSAFSSRVTYVVLHLKDERRLYGWLREWPSDPGQGHFLILEPAWVVEGEEKPIEGVESILVDVKDIRWVEFMEKTWENENGEQAAESSTARPGKGSKSGQPTQSVC